MNKRNSLRIIGAVGITAIIMLVLLRLDIFSEIFSNNKSIGSDKPPVQLNATADALNKAYVDASNAVTQSVVSISVKIEIKNTDSPHNQEFHNFFKFFGLPYDEGQGDGGEGDSEPYRTEGAGSGVIVSEDGYIVTNNHVVEEATEDGIEVITLDKKKYQAKLIGKDPLTDLALIKIDAKGLKPVHLASIDNVKVGELVIAVGNPLGLNSTVTTGIVSAIGRGQLNLLSSRDRYSVENFIQTDAAINPGNSGGGLFNLQGSLIGINTAIASRTGTYIGYGFAIPVDLVKAVVSDLIENGTINRGVIGIEIRSIDEVEAKAVGLDAVEGIFVQKVLPDSPAEKAGVESGDVIIELDGKKVRTSNELQSMLVFHHAGDEVKLTIWRDNNRINKTLKLKSIDNITAKNEEVASKGDEERENFKADKKVEFEKLGFSVEPLNNEQKEKYDVKNGVVISNVKRYSVAYDRGLVAQGIITKADRKSVNSPKDLEKIIDSKKPGEAIMLQVNYKDNLRMVALEIPKK